MEAVGGALAKGLAAVGIKVVVGSRDPEKAVRFASEIGSQNGGSSISGAGLVAAAEQADICFVTVPYAAHIHIWSGDLLTNSSDGTSAQKGNLVRACFT